jgi:hypothetical protein
MGIGSLFFVVVSGRMGKPDPFGIMGGLNANRSWITVKGI